MRTKNFGKYLCVLAAYPEIVKKSGTYSYVGFNIVNTSGKQKSYAYASNYANRFTGVLTVGTGTTPPTEDDYKLENKIDLTLMEQGVILDHINHMMLVGTFTNNTSEAVTITEVAYEIAYNDGEDYFIFSRDLITPITIPSGETRTIQYTIQF